MARLSEVDEGEAPEAFAVGVLARLVGQRSAPAPDGAPPSTGQLTWLLQAATSVPDHGSLRPWRFVVVAAGERARFGDALAADLLDAHPDAPAGQEAKMRGKAFAAPALIALVASPHPASKVPEWEQVASAACCGYAIVLAAQTLGLGAVWKSSPLMDGPHVRALFRLTADERLLGWVNVGSPGEAATGALRPAADLSAAATVLTPDGARPFRR